MLRVAPALLTIAGLLGSAPARARDAAPIDLSWQAPAGCPSSDAVLARVAELAGETRGSGTPLQAEAVVTQRADGQFRMRLVVKSGDLVAARNMEGRSCADLVGAAAVALALLLSSEEPLDERSLDAQPASSASGSEKPATSVEPPAPVPAPPAGADDDDDDGSAPTGPVRRWHGLLTLPIAALSIGPQREPVRGLGLAAGASFDRWRFRAEGKLWASQTATTTQQSDQYGAELDRFTIGLRACRSLWGTRFEIGPCAVLSLQHLSVRGLGPHIAPRTPKATWVAGGVGLQARALIVPWFSLLAGVDGDVQLSRPEIRLDGVGLVDRFSPFAATMSVGFEWIL